MHSAWHLGDNLYQFFSDVFLLKMRPGVPGTRTTNALCLAPEGRIHSAWHLADNLNQLFSVVFHLKMRPGVPGRFGRHAFLIRPGQAVWIQARIWHAMGLPAGQEPGVYGFLLGAPTSDPAESSGWVTFAGEELVEIRRA